MVRGVPFSYFLSITFHCIQKDRFVSIDITFINKAAIEVSLKVIPWSISINMSCEYRLEVANLKCNFPSSRHQIKEDTRLRKANKHSQKQSYMHWHRLSCIVGTLAPPCRVLQITGEVTGSSPVRQPVRCGVDFAVDLYLTFAAGSNDGCFISAGPVVRFSHFISFE